MPEGINVPEMAYGFSFLAVVLVGLGYASDLITRDHGFGPPVNGALLVFGAALGIAGLFVYFRFWVGVLAFNIYRAHLFDLYFVTTLGVAAASALLFFILVLFLKHSIAD